MSCVQLGKHAMPSSQTQRRDARGTKEAHVALVAVAVALGVEVAHDAGERVEHGGAVREKLRAPGGCTKHMHQ